MASKFEIYQSPKSGEYYFRLKAANGQVVLSSEGYSNKAGAKNGVESVKKNAPDKANFEVKEAKNGKFHFNLLAKNKQIIGSSQMYASSSGCSAGVKAVESAADGANVVEV